MLGSVVVDRLMVNNMSGEGLMEVYLTTYKASEL
jgi:hypothetical protein